MISHDISEPRRDYVLVIGPKGAIEINYEWGLAGPGGAWFRLEPKADTPEEYIAEAQSCLRRNRDVVSLSVRRPS
jgi:hypothetical protein